MKYYKNGRGRVGWGCNEILQEWKERVEWGCNEILEEGKKESWVIANGKDGERQENF